MIPQFIPIFDAADAQAVADVVKSGYINESKLTAEFERKLAEFVGAKYAIATTSGTVAIALALKAVGVTPGHKVIVPDQTMVGSSNAIRLAGCTPWIIDVNSDDAEINLSELAKCDDAQIQAVLPVHINGRSCAMPQILELAEKRSWKVVEDAAQCLGSRNSRKHLGTFGDAGAFSFATTKIITTGGGGAVVTNNEETFMVLRALKDQGRNDRTLTGFSGPEEYYPFEGYNFKFDEIKAALGLSQFNKLEARIAHKRRIVKLYQETMGQSSNWVYPEFESEELPWYFDMKFALPSLQISVRAELKRQGIGNRAYYRPIHLQPQYQFNAIGTCANTQNWFESGMFLPSSSNLSDDQIVFIGSTVTHAPGGT